MMPATATMAGVGSAAVAAQSAGIPIVATAVSIFGLLAILIVILCYVAVFGSCSRSTRAIKVLALLIGRTWPGPPEGGEAQSDS
jgi:hypothetical protein